MGLYQGWDSVTMGHKSGTQRLQEVKRYQRARLGLHDHWEESVGLQGYLVLRLEQKNTSWQTWMQEHQEARQKTGQEIRLGPYNGQRGVWGCRILCNETGTADKLLDYWRT